MKLAVVLSVLCTSSALKYMISCDPGADDAEALVYMMQYAPDDLVALLPTHGNGYAHLSVQNVLRIRKLMNSKVKVFMGASRGFDTVPHPSTWFGSDALGDIPDEGPKVPKQKRIDRFKTKKTASQHIVDFARKNPGELVVILQASLTDLAMAYLIEPNLPNLLNRTVIIGGNMHGGGNAGPVTEFNIYADPIAARLVIDNFNALLIPYEVAQAKVMDWDWHDKTWLGQGTAVGDFIAKAEMPATERLKSWYAPYAFADQIAPALVLSPSLILKTEKHPGTVEICGSSTQGEVVVDFRPGQDKPSNLELVMDFDLEKMKENYVAAFGPDPPSTPPN